MQVANLTEDQVSSLQDQGYSTDDLSLLTDEEVKILLDDDGADDSDDAPSPKAKDDDEDPHDKAAREQAEAIAAAASADGAAKAASEQVEKEADTSTTEETKDDGKAFVPQYAVEVPADAAEQIKALKAEDAEAFKKLIAGEMEPDAYQAIKDRTEAAIDDLKTKAMTAAIFQQANAQATEQAAAQEWKRAENAAMNTFKAEGIDYRGKPALLAAYNTTLKALADDAKNANRDAPWFLAEAHRLTKAELGIVTAPKPTPKPGDRRNPLADVEIPPTLRGAPAAATSAIDTDEFSHMRGLGGIELERAVAKLTPDQLDRYLA